MDANFPGAKDINMDADFAAKFASAHPDASEFTKKRAGLIHAKSLVRHGLIVLAEDTKIVEDVVGVLGGTCSVHEPRLNKGDSDDQTFHDTITKDEFAKASSSSACHWVIFSAAKGSYWPEFVEPLNTVCDDNKRLTMSNGEVVLLPPNCRIVLVTPDVKQMTPACVSRHGVINTIQ